MPGRESRGMGRRRKDSGASELVNGGRARCSSEVLSKGRLDWSYQLVSLCLVRKSACCST